MTRASLRQYAPVICIGGQTPPVVHVAGGMNRIVEEAGRRRLIETYAHSARPLADVLAEIACAPTMMAEFHAILIRTESLRALGGLDECCPTAFEHNDLCLWLASRGERVGWSRHRSSTTSPMRPRLSRTRRTTCCGGAGPNLDR